METQLSDAVAGNGFSPTGGSASVRTPYIDQAPLNQVMLEQLEYLLAHGDATCTPECADCSRLTQVQKWLLLPFLRA